MAFQAQNVADVIATTDYGQTVTAAVRRGHVWGTQFHPEKSSKAGFKILKNFIEGLAC
jgi:glutamine amidotransferase